ncbi:MAG: hypothetical protein HKN20_07390 [Gemmatimonadetes bacterium]|nr:hypothetical protein [Gemmatimonadota bacterium]
MSGRINYKSIFAGIGCALLLSFTSASAQTVFMGFDADGDSSCSENEMIFPSATVSNDQTFSIFYDISDAMAAGGCTFCVEDGATISIDAIVPGDSIVSTWTIEDVKNSEDNPSISVSDWIKTGDYSATYKCWVISFTDFTFAAPHPAGIVNVLDVQYDVLQAGRVGFMIDGANSAYLTTGFSSVSCGTTSTPDDNCQCLETAGTATEQASWGQVKALFR